jgi:GTP-binding protein HflX
MWQISAEIFRQKTGTRPRFCVSVLPYRKLAARIECGFKEPRRTLTDVTERDRKQSVESEVAVLAGVIFPDKQFTGPPLDELQGLAEAAGARVVGRLCQRRDKPAAAAYLGSGKVGELAALVDQEDADLILFDNELSPAQTRNLEKATGVKVLDRTELILDIFASHAQTYESRLAVELAQLEYSLPRLKRMWTHLSRLKMGIGMRGPGEKQLEVDRRLVEKRIHDLRSELKQIERRKERQVAARREHMTVSLVGYTNAGKSTLMNVLTDADVEAADQLFATLDTRTRRWQLPHWGPVLLSDTVGFIRDLPHKLVASFKATLQESRQADLLLHVADASNDAVADQISAVVGVLADLGIDEKDTLLVLNKVDAVGSEASLNSILRRYPNAVAVSAKNGDGLDRLALTVSDALSRSFRDVDIETNVGNGKLMAYLAARGEVLSRRYEGDRAILHCRIPQKFLGRITDDDCVIRHRDATQNGATHGDARADDGEHRQVDDRHRADSPQQTAPPDSAGPTLEDEA